MLSPSEGLKAETRFVTCSRRSTFSEHFACSPVTPRSADTTRCTPQAVVNNSKGETLYIGRIDRPLRDHWQASPGG